MCPRFKLSRSNRSLCCKSRQTCCSVQPFFVQWWVIIQSLQQMKAVDFKMLQNYLSRSRLMLCTLNFDDRCQACKCQSFTLLYNILKLFKRPNVDIFSTALHSKYLPYDVMFENFKNWKTAKMKWNFYCFLAFFTRKNKLKVDFYW